MILWFAGMSFLLVWQVFRSPAIDYRMVMLGAVLPTAEVLTGGPRVLHTLIGSVALLTIVMLATRGHRLVRRRWLGLPIGTFLHLVLDGIWTRAHLFWWPFFGWAFGDGQSPELTRGAFAIVLEVAGAGALAWCWRRFGLDDRSRRDVFLRTGHLDCDLVG